MSTGRECTFFMHDNKAYYLLQDGSCPVDAWDWREYATCYGPFNDIDEAMQHLSDNHANPGGYSTQNGNTDDELLIELTKEAYR